MSLLRCNIQPKESELCLESEGTCPQSTWHGTETTSESVHTVNFEIILTIDFTFQSDIHSDIHSDIYRLEGRETCRQLGQAAHVTGSQLTSRFTPAAAVCGVVLVLRYKILAYDDIPWNSGEFK